MQTRERLIAILQKKNLPIPNSDYDAFGYDSLSTMMLVYETETEFGIQFGLSDFDTELTLSRLIELVESK